MGLYNINSHSSGIFFQGLLLTVGLMKRRKNIIDDVFKDFFTAPDTKEQWTKIQRIIGLHGRQKMLPIGACASKPQRQSDGQRTPFMLEKQIFDLAMMYEDSVDEGILIDEEGMQTFWDPAENSPDSAIQQIIAMQKWHCLIDSFEVCYHIEDYLTQVWESIRPLYKGTNKFLKTPAQHYFHTDEFMYGNLFGPWNGPEQGAIFDGLGKPVLLTVPWDVIETFFKNGSDGIIDIMFRGPVSDIWFAPIPEITFYPDQEETFTIDIDIETSPGSDTYKTGTKSYKSSPVGRDPGMIIRKGSRVDAPDGANARAVPNHYLHDIWGVSGNITTTGIGPLSASITVTYDTVDVTYP